MKFNSTGENLIVWLAGLLGWFPRPETTFPGCLSPCLKIFFFCAGNDFIDECELGKVTNNSNNVTMRLRRVKQKQSSSERVLFANVRSEIGLVQHDDRRRICTTTIGGALRCDAKSKRHVGHVVNDDALLRLGAFRHSADARFEHIVAVEELLFRIWLQPHSPLEHVGSRRQSV